MKLQGKPTSDLSAYADSIYKEFHDFHFADGDIVSFVRSAQPFVYRRDSGILRVIERKRGKEQLLRSQEEILPGLAELIRMGVVSGVLQKGSGVWVARRQNEHNELREVLAGPFARRNLPAQFQLGEPFDLTDEEFRDFVRCLRARV